jgi:hypothetical protein
VSMMRCNTFACSITTSHVVPLASMSWCLCRLRSLAPMMRRAVAWAACYFPVPQPFLVLGTTTSPPARTLLSGVLLSRQTSRHHLSVGKIPPAPSPTVIWSSPLVWYTMRPLPSALTSGNVPSCPRQTTLLRFSGNAKGPPPPRDPPRTSSALKPYTNAITVTFHATTTSLASKTT